MGSVLIWLGALGFSGLLGWMARRRGRDPLRWAALGFFFGPLPLPVLLWRRRRG